MTTPQSVEEIIKEFIYTVWCSRLKEFDYTTDDEEERAHPTDMFVNWLRAHLTTYGNARFEEGVTKGRVSVLQDFDNMCMADAFMGFTDEEWSAVRKFFAFNKKISNWDK